MSLSLSVMGDKVHIHAGACQRPEESVSPSETRVAGACELSKVGAEH